MAFPPPGQKRRSRPDNEATIDHLRSRLNPARQEPACGERRLVLACLRCNSERGREEQARLPRRVLQERAQNGHSRWD